MDKNRESIIFACTLTGAISDIIAILVVLSSDVAIKDCFLLLTLLVLLFITLFLSGRYKERCEFLQFVEHLFENDTKKLTMLPKICMALDGSGEKKNLHVNEMIVRHIFDFSEVKPALLLNDVRVNYKGIVEYEMIIENKNIPPVYTCFLGDMYSDPSSKILQKHGCNTTYQDVPAPEDKRTAVKSAVTKYSWHLDKNCITKGNQLPLSFKLEQHGYEKINSVKTIVLYPKQYGESVDKVHFEISCICDQIIFKRADLFKIWKNQGKYTHTSIPGTAIKGNTAKMTITPCANKYEAYYFNLYFEVP